MIDAVLDVWHLSDAVFTALVGVGVGALAVGRYASDPVYASGEATPRSYGMLIALMGVALGLVFFGLLAIATYLEGSSGWLVVASYLGLWVLFSLTIGLGTYARLVLDDRGKGEEARRRAESELNGGSRR